VLLLEVRGDGKLNILNEKQVVFCVQKYSIFGIKWDSVTTCDFLRVYNFVTCGLCGYSPLPIHAMKAYSGSRGVSHSEPRH
jgi:hypothetical protein